jgi:hypothetical protein
LPHYLIVDILIPLLHVDSTVSIGVGFTRLQSLHQIFGEERIFCLPSNIIALPGILCGVCGC